MRPKGMRAIRTTRSLNRSPRATSREQQVAELARLEHEKARLSRELDVWRQNAARTNDQLERVEVRLNELRELLRADEPVPIRPAHPRRRPAERRDDDEGEWKTVSLEY
ncbi:MAG: hypothetical protein HC822_07610 [Oscillochloris sp.]|nr:hypothetical protein [Oscillochloris sp.]